MSRVVSIRRRERRQASPREGMRQSWVEYQVVLGRTIIHRAEIFEQAQRWCADGGYAYPDRPSFSL